MSELLSIKGPKGRIFYKKVAQNSTTRTTLLSLILQNTVFSPLASTIESVMV